MAIDSRSSSFLLLAFLPALLAFLLFLELELALLGDFLKLQEDLFADEVLQRYSFDVLVHLIAF